MKFYSEAAMERAMRIQEVILRAIGKRISWWQAAEIIGIGDRQMRRSATEPRGFPTTPFGANRSRPAGSFGQRQTTFGRIMKADILTC